MQIKSAPGTPAIPSAAKLYIEPKQPSLTTVAEPQKTVVAKPVTEAPVAAVKTAAASLSETLVKPLPNKPKEPVTGKQSLLQTLRDKHITNKTNERIKEAVPVTEENLQEHWKCFTEKLKQQLKHSVVTVFNNAALQVVNEQHFSITVSASLEQKFIEQEKLPLLEYLKDCFQNRNIGFTIHINEQPKEIVISEQTLTTREKYQKVIEQYPMIKELKDRLRLELDY